MTEPKPPRFAAGQLVTYWDIANQNGPVREVVATPADTEGVNKWGAFYLLMDIATGRLEESDCRQHGWQLVQDIQGAP